MTYRIAGAVHHRPKDGNGAAGFDGWARFVGFVAGLAIATTFWMIATLQELHGQHVGKSGVTAGFDSDDARRVLPMVVWGRSARLAPGYRLSGRRPFRFHGREVSRRSA